MEQRTYEEYKALAIDAYSKLYKDSVAFDYARVPKDIRIRLLEDEEYQMETKGLKAELYYKQIKKLDEIIKGEHSDADPDKGDASEIMKGIEMRNKLLFNDLNIDADESNALNIFMVAMSREDFEKLPTAEIFINESNQGNVDPSDVLEDAATEPVEREVKW